MFKRTGKVISAASRAATKLLFRPIFKQKPERKNGHLKSRRDEKISWYEFLTTLSWSKVEAFMFPHMPEHYPLSKKLDLAKSQSLVGKLWDVLLIMMSILACAIYVSETYTNGYNSVQVYSFIEIVITQFFAADFLYNLASSSNTFQYLTDGWTIVDIITIVPVYITIGLRESGEGNSSGVNLSIFRFVRILRLIRILRMFKLLNGLTGVQRQLVQLSLTLSSLIFMAAGIVHMMENDLKQHLEINCDYINANTGWEPSCSKQVPFTEDPDQATCECVSRSDDVSYTCEAVYEPIDKMGQPSGIRCSTMTFLDAFYFLVVTVSTVGYGDISPTTQASRAVIVFFITLSVVLIPMQLNELNVLLAANSTYRQPYLAKNGESHIIICGYISDTRKLEKFLKEFFHPDKQYSAAPDFHAVIMSPMEPSDDIKALLYNNHFDDRVTYLIGSSLNPEDLQKARADMASAMFFFCNAETPEDNATLDDAATVLRTLSAMNFNPQLESFVQVLKAEDRDILKDSDVETILCLDEYKTCLQARNAMCPGLSTFIENLFHTFSLPHVIPNKEPYSNNQSQWLGLYNHGLSMEPYFITLPNRFAEVLSFEWTLMVEAIYLEFDAIVLGVGSSKSHNIIINPGRAEFRKHKYLSRFFDKYNMLVLLCSEQSMALSIAESMRSPEVLDRMLNKLLIAEDSFAVRKAKAKNKVYKEAKKEMHVPSIREIVRLTKSWANSFSGKESGGDEEGKEGDAYYGFIKSKSKNKKDGSSMTAAASLGKLKHLAAKNSGAASSKVRKYSSISTIDDDEEFGDSYSNDSDDDEESGMVDTTTNMLKRIHRQSSFKGAGLNIPGMVPPPSMPTSPTLGAGGTVLPAHSKHVRRAHTDDDDWSNEDGHSDGHLSDRSGPLSSRNRQRTESEVSIGAEEAYISHCNDFSGHIIVFGCVSNLFLFLSELRKDIHVMPRADGSFQHPVVVIVNKSMPPKWDVISSVFENVFWLKGRITKSRDFNLTNMHNALSVVLLAGRDNVTKVEQENLDAEALFSYLKLEKYIPKGVYFTVELTCASNMAVLNSTVVRRARALQPKSIDETDVGKPKKRRNGAGKGRHSIITRLSMGFVPQRGITLKTSKVLRDGVDMSQGQFSNHRAVMTEAQYHNINRGTQNALFNVPARRLSSLEPKFSGDGYSGTGRKGKRFENFWTTQDTHHLLSVFASGNAFVPAAFDALLANSFYTAFTPLLCERLVCGTKTQSIYQVDVPLPFVGRYFVDMFRAFMSRQLMVIAIYRYPDPSEGSVLPYVMTCPPADCKLAFKDKMFIAANPEVLVEYLPILSERLVEEHDGSMALGECLSEELHPDGEKRENQGTHDIASASEEKGGSPDSSSTSMRSKSISTPVLPTGTALRQSPGLKAVSRKEESPVRAAVSRIYFAGEENRDM